MKGKQKRELTVGSKYQARVRMTYAVIPEIRLTGKWLEESGFTEGSKVSVFIEHGKLVITPGSS